MTASIVFSFSNLLAMIMWLLMIIVPNWKVTQSLITHKAIPIVLSLVYIVYITKAMMISGSLDFGSLASVMALFTEENAVLGGWVHYLAFDLIVGMYILDQNKTLRIKHWLIVPCLLCTFMLGPIGFLLFVIIKKVKS